MGSRSARLARRLLKSSKADISGNHRASRIEMGRIRSERAIIFNFILDG